MIKAIIFDVGSTLRIGPDRQKRFGEDYAITGLSELLSIALQDTPRP